MDFLSRQLDRYQRLRRSLRYQWNLRAMRRRPDALRVGWVVFGSLENPAMSLFDLAPPVSMRVRDVAIHLNEHRADIWNEMYRAGQPYDVVVFFKAMSSRYQQEVTAIRERGAKVVFDCNVNYYEDWGTYRIPSNRPTAEQQRDVVAMTRIADHVVADSTYIRQVALAHNPAVTVVPDNVDLHFYRGGKVHRDREPVELIWCGVSTKADHLLMILDSIPESPRFALTLVSDAPPPAAATLEKRIPCRYVPFTEDRFRRELLAADILLSPKYQECSYDMGHTEYKISPGMAMGLPVIASPQQSYVEALGAHGGGILARDGDEWRAALERLGRDAALRATMGALARRTVVERYSTSVVATTYHDLLMRLGRAR